MLTVGVLGGTFDPIHYGHLRTIVAIKQLLSLQQVRILPCYQSALKKMPYASADDRIAMLQLACRELTDVVIDERELSQKKACYSINSLRSLRAELGNESILNFIIGFDQFANLQQWYQWQQLTQYCHLIIVPRGKQQTVNVEVNSWFQQHSIDEPKQLMQQPHGFIYYCQQLPTLTISASYIRNLISQQLSPQFLLPNSVLQYITEKNLYIQSEII